MKNRTAYLWTYGAVVFTTLCLIFVTPHFDSDPVWSIEIGKYIANYGFPHADPFSWTVQGKPWLTHEWLFCVMLFWLNEALGNWGYIVYIGASLSLLGFAAYLLAKAEKASMFGYLMAAGALLMLYIAGYAQSRAYLLSFSFVLLLIYFIRTDRIWYIPVLFVLWANWHSSIIMGLVVLGIESLYRIYRTRNWDTMRVFLWSLIAGLINPYGWRIYWYAVQTMLAPESKYITEWQAPNFGSYTTLFLYVGVAGLVLIAQNLFIKKGYKHDSNGLIDGIWFWLFFIYALNTSRGLSFALLFFIPYMLYLTKDLVSNTYKKAPVHIALILVLFSSSYASAASINWPPYESKEWPNQAVVFLQNHPDYQDRVFNEYLWGAMLISSGIKPFIDARCDVYMENGVMKDYMRASSLKEAPEKIFKKYGVETVLISTRSPLDIYLDAHREWQEVYRDRTAVIYHREEIL